MRTVALVIVVLALSSVGCRKHHLIKDFGESYVRAFAAQQDRTKKPAEATQGLDSQEAAITADNYRATLVPEGAQLQPEPMLFVAPPGRERREPLPPSVPKE